MEKINILLVDDQPSKLLTYEAVLASLGENLIRARSGEEALEYLLRNDIAIVLTDVNMPGFDGFQLVNTIRRHPRFQDLAVIFVSATRMAESDRLDGYRLGAVDYIPVPIAPELLRAKVRLFAELHRKRRELEALYSEMRTLSARLMAAQDEERRRIARELHDELGQELTAAKLALDGILAPECAEKTIEASQLVARALQTVRNISYLLHPPLLDEMGLESAVRWFLEGLTKRSGIETTLRILTPDFPRLPPEFETAIYRVIQEAITNAFRHSEARKISVSLSQSDGHISVIVDDNGKGIPQEIADFRPGAVGVGLGGMRQRVRELRGELQLMNVNPGTRVEVVIPQQAGTTECNREQEPVGTAAGGASRTSF